ncbi:MAG: hypothetical protein WC767_02510, partial [Candidatus Paceibacterota bacterium]|jgi:hypothetical protein
MLPSDILDALSAGKISEGHARPLMMLVDRPEEQSTLFKEILFKRLTVRESELIARKIAVEKARKKERLFDPEIVEMEQKLSETFGTRVSIEQREKGGKITIDFFSPEDLRTILSITESQQKRNPHAMLNAEMAKKDGQQATGNTGETNNNSQITTETENAGKTSDNAQIATEDATILKPAPEQVVALSDDRSKDEKKESDNSEDLYSIKNFSL